MKKKVVSLLMICALSVGMLAGGGSSETQNQATGSADNTQTAGTETVAETNDRPVVHSDRGGHYRWPGWLSRMSDADLTRSMSRKACSPDNAACEGFFGRLKNELFYPRDWKSVTIEQFIGVVDDYIRWYNEKRIKISLGALSPIEYRVSLGLAA